MSAQAERERFETLAAAAIAHLAKALEGPAGAAEEELALAADCTSRASASAGIIRAQERQ